MADLPQGDMVGQRTFDEIARYTATHTTFSGADIVAVFNGVPIGGLSGITWSVSREKAPVFTMGSANPRSFSRGKRGIAGSLIFTTFDRPALYDLIAAEVGNGRQRIWTRNWNGIANTNSTLASTIIPNGNVMSSVSAVIPYYMDQLLPFDITITYHNEYGMAAVRSIYGVELLNEGSGVSMDDMQVEETMTYVAREVGPMIPTSGQFSEISGTIDKKVVVAGFGLNE
jgi:hypothetical protein